MQGIKRPEIARTSDSNTRLPSVVVCITNNFIYTDVNEIMTEFQN